MPSPAPRRLAPRAAPGRLRALAVALAAGALLAPVAAAHAAEPRLNEIQAIGSHNSYHLERTPAEVARVGPQPPPFAYAFPRLRDQLGEQGVRQLELDVWADPQGGRYADQQLRRQAGLPPLRGAMTRPGIKVQHVPDLDYRSSCRTFVACLREVRSWSRANPRHVPVAVLVELKDDAALGTAPGLIRPLPWTASRMDAVDREIRSVFGRDDLLVPDDVRGRRSSLETAVRRDGWPRLRDVRGRVMFLMDNGGAYRSRYLRGHPALRGRVLFTNAEPGARDAAFVKVNEVRDGGEARIRRLVRGGYVVRTRADVDTVEARTDDRTRLASAVRSGAQWVSTDYPARGIARQRFGTAYAGLLPGARTLRCNPVTASRACRTSRLER